MKVYLKIKKNNFNCFFYNLNYVCICLYTLNGNRSLPIKSHLVNFDNPYRPRVRVRGKSDGKNKKKYLKQ